MHFNLMGLRKLRIVEIGMFSLMSEEAKLKLLITKLLRIKSLIILQDAGI